MITRDIKSLMLRLFAVCVVIILASCNGVGVKEYMQFVENPESGLKKVCTNDSYVFELQYKPTEYIAILENRDKELADKVVSKRTNELDGMEYFNLKLGTNNGLNFLKNNVSSDIEVQQRINYFKSRAQSEIFMLNGNDTTHCDLYHFEQYYGSAPYEMIVIGFKKSDKDTDKRIVFEAKELGLEPIEFVINQNDINNIPKLNI